MKKNWPYILIALAVIVIIIMVLNKVGEKPRAWDDRITLKGAHKIPYGTSASKELLAEIFPGVPVYFNTKPPESWDSINRWANNQAVFFISDYFNADEDETARIIDFAAQGNFVFIVARGFSYDSKYEFGFDYTVNNNQAFLNIDDSLQLRLEPNFFPDHSLYQYPGFGHQSYFSQIDTARTIVLGRNHLGWPNFIQMNAGRGRVFIHLAPLAFSNYFVLHKNNHLYFQQALSVIPPKPDKILWNEYFLVKREKQNDKSPGWLSVLLQYPAFKWGLITGMLTLLLYVLLNMRRRQRMIPPLVKPKNDSLDFVKTMGGLYYQKKDHLNLARKMSAHFLDHVRSRYKLGTLKLDDNFIMELEFKTGYHYNNLKQLVDFINFLETAPAISDGQLVTFHKQIELFYQNT